MDNNFFPVFLDLTGRKVLVYGAGNIAARRVELLLRFGAEITIIAPEVMPKMEEVIRLAEFLQIEPTLLKLLCDGSDREA